jgi:hypothetical protein
MLGGAISSLGMGVGAYPLLAGTVEKSRKKLLLIFLSGGPSQLETWDPKPGTKYGGPLRAIPTSVKGTHISELLPNTAKIMHQLAVIRSLNTGIADHFQGHYALQSGRTVPGFPVLGSALAKLLEQDGDQLPGYVEMRRDGPKAYTDVGDAGFLGPKYESVKVINGEPPDYLIRPDTISESKAQLVDQLRQDSDQRFLQGRSELPIRAYGGTFSRAVALMKQRGIFDIEKESTSDRELYGSHLFGRHCLMARRLLESGVSCVKVASHDWDAHQENFHWHQQRCSEFDRTFPALVTDFERRGLLEDTLVVVMGEMGRTPQINNRGGRDHWGKAWSMAMTGCGVKRGIIHGKTNAEGTEVVEGEVHAGDLFNTFLSALDISPRKRYRMTGQPIPAGDPAGSTIREVLV